MYPVVPGDPTYAIGTPWFDKMSWHLDKGKTFVVQAPGVSAANRFIKSATYDRKPWKKSWLSHEMLQSGGTMEFEMTATPGAWGSAEPDRPLSVVMGEQTVPVPFVSKGTRAFRDKQSIELACLDADAQIWYITGKPSDQESRFLGGAKKYAGPLEIDKSTRLFAWAEKEGRISLVSSALFEKTKGAINVLRYNTQYNTQYTARGDEGLIDGVRGGADFRTGDWQGFEGANLDIVLDLGKKRKIRQLTAGFLQDENAWIFFPLKVQVEISDDGVRFSPAGEDACQVSPAEKGTLLKDFRIDLRGKKARYLRLTAVARGKCPDGHKGAGNPCWIFADEILVD
jgi:hypothetical protein